MEFTLDGQVKPGKTGHGNNPDDPGKETNFGIPVAEAQADGWSLPMGEMTYEFAVDHYRRKFWNPILGDAITDQEVAYELFDTAVNCGIGTTIKFIQRALNALNIKGTLWADIKADGWLGGATLGALNSALASRPWMRLCILRAIDSLQAVRYINLAEKNQKFETFLPGWIRARCGVKEE